MWFFLCTLVSSTNKSDHHDITEILLNVTLNTITLTLLSKRNLEKTVEKIRNEHNRDTWATPTHQNRNRT